MVEVIYQGQRYDAYPVAGTGAQVIGYQLINYQGAAFGMVVPANQVTLVEGNDPPTSGNLVWTVTTDNAAMQSDIAYLVDAGGLISLSLPNDSMGARIAISDRGGGLFSVTQGATQQIRYGNKITTAGTTGRIDSTQIGDYLELVFTGWQWLVTQSVGNFDVV